MMHFPRTDTSLISRWWWTVDRWTLAAILALAMIGAMLGFAASPAIALDLGLPPFHFVHRQIVFLCLGMTVIFATSLLSPHGVRRLAILVFVLALAATLATLWFGPVIKGATRWLIVGGLSIQPSEFLKPAFAVVSAWLIAAARRSERLTEVGASMLVLFVLAAVFAAQPDVGTTLLVCATWSLQIFLAGCPWVLIALIALVFCGGAVAAYLNFPHVRERIDHFLDPSAGDGYQIGQALDAFRSGGLFGRGPGEGRVKDLLPDAHADFIFAVAGEEFGLLVCLAIILLFALVVVQGLGRALQDDDLFVVLAASSLIALFGLQALMNIATSLHMMPPKGTTLPFISYGGSATLGLAWSMGMVLALTRWRPNPGATP